MKAAGISLLICTLALAGCGPAPWERMAGPDSQGTKALAAVNAFIATNGWSMRTNADAVCWEEIPSKQYIQGLPWKKLNASRFEALTQSGILFVLLDSGFHHDYSGVAYNPNTNRFPWNIRGFKPIGGHWYVWCQPEFLSHTLTQAYE